MERLAFTVDDHLDALVAWDVITQDAPLFMQSDFLRALEDAPSETCSPIYAVLSDSDRPVAALAGQLLTIHVDRAAPTSNSDGTLARLAQSALEHVDIEVALWGNFLTWGHPGVALAPNIDPDSTWPRVAQSIYRLRRDVRALRTADLYMVLDVPADRSSDFGHLTEHGFDAFETEPDMVLDLPSEWKSFDDYLAALKSKYRKASLEMDERLNAAGCTIERLDDIEPHADRLHELYQQVHERSAHRFVTLERNTLPALARRLGVRFRCNVVRRGEQILGFGTTLFDRDTAIAYVVGHDVEENRSLPIYLRLLQVAVADGIEHGCRRVTYGRTALEPKARVGATPRALVVYGRHKNRLVTALISGLMQAITPHEDPPKRRPFSARQ